MDNGFSHSMSYSVNGSEISMSAYPLNSTIFNLCLSKTNVPAIFQSVPICSGRGSTSPIVYFQFKS